MRSTRQAGCSRRSGRIRGALPGVLDLNVAPRLSASSCTVCASTGTLSLASDSLVKPSSVMRCWISALSILLQRTGPSVKPNWNAATRSNALPCADSSVLVVPTWSRMNIIVASTWLSPLPVESWKCGAPPPATQRMNAPA
jgi:hypothetical protein